jgi:hypothetical protein
MSLRSYSRCRTRRRNWWLVLVLCFEGGIGGDVLRHIFGPDDFFRKQIKAERGKEKRR